jgi:hypothetical protein
MTRARGLVVLDARVLLVRIPLRALVGGLRSHVGWDGFGDELVDAIRIGPSILPNWSLNS